MGQKTSLFKMRGLTEVRCLTSSGGHTNELSKLFTLLSWNVNKQCDSQRWRREVEFVQNIHKPSLSLFQEVNLTDSLENFWNGMGLQFGFTPNITLDSGQKDFAGVATVSTAKAISHESRLTLKTEPLFNTPKPLLISTFRLHNGSILTVVNLHGINFVSSAAFKQQMEQIQRALYNSKGAAIVAGDFNMWSHKRKEIVHELFSSFPEKEFQEVDFNEHVHHIKRAPLLVQKIHGYHHLDRIFFSAATLKVVPETAHVHTIINGEKLVSSDHFPISCSLLTL